MTETAPIWGDEPPRAPEPPKTQELEMALLGAVLSKPSLLDLVADKVAADHFGEPALGSLWGILLRLHETGRPVHLPALINPYMAETGWDRKDVQKALARIAASMVTTFPPDVQNYAHLITDAWIRRELLDAGKEVMHQAARTKDGAATVLEYMSERLETLSGARSAEESSMSLPEAMAKAMEQAHAATERHESGKLAGVRTGLRGLDEKLGGWRDTDFLVIGARPGMGKTALLVKAARTAAESFVAENPEKPKWVYIASLEMSADQIAMRMACAEARISPERVLKGLCDADELRRLEEAAQSLRDLPIHIDDSVRTTPATFRIRMRRWKRKHGLGLALLDYLQLMSLSKAELRGAEGNRVQEMSIITRQMKAIAKDLQIPLVALSQLSREVEKREDKRPQMSDLRESGTIEQDADAVMFIYREAYYLLQKPIVKRDREKEMDFLARKSEAITKLEDCKDVAEIIIGKNRHGSQGIVYVKFEAELMLFHDDRPGDATPAANEMRQSQMSLAWQLANA